MVSTLVSIFTHWIGPAMSHDIKLSGSHDFTKLLDIIEGHNFTKLLDSIVSQP